MAIVKSYSFTKGDIRGDMFYICHGADCFTIIDCNFAEDRGKEIISEIKDKSKDKSILRFISTHPDNDHILGIEELFSQVGIPVDNFYAVKNDINEEESNTSLGKYIELKDSPDSWPIYKGVKRNYLNKDETNNNIGGCGLHFYWPDTSNEVFKKVLNSINDGGLVNNICPIFSYSIKNNATFLWMGDLQTSMQKEFYKNYKGEIGKVNVLFAPHHGRESGQVPEDFLKEINPDIVVLGNAPTENLKSSYNYYNKDRTITQNSAGDIWFECYNRRVDVYTNNECGNMPKILKIDETKKDVYYRGTLYL